MPDTQDVANRLNRMAADARLLAQMLAQRDLNWATEQEWATQLLRDLAGVAEAAAMYVGRRGGLQP